MSAYTRIGCLMDLLFAFTIQKKEDKKNKLKKLFKKIFKSISNLTGRDLETGEM